MTEPENPTPEVEAKPKGKAKPIAETDPTFPPIEARYLALTEAGNVIGWAARLGYKPQDPEHPAGEMEAARRHILRHEYGVAVFAAWEAKFPAKK